MKMNLKLKKKKYYLEKLLALFLLSPLVVSDEKSYDKLSSNKATAVNIETGESFYVSGVLSG